MSKTREQLEAWIKTKYVSGNVLDVGGSQLPVSERIAYDNETEFKILDLEVPHLELKKPDLIGDLNSAPEFEGYEEYFDYATCFEVSEYWWNPSNALWSIHKLLKKNGTLMISFHFIYPVHNPFELDYMRYTRNGAIKLLNEAGFKVVEIASRLGSKIGLLECFRQEGMRPSRDYTNHHEVGVLIEAVKK